LGAQSLPEVDLSCMRYLNFESVIQEAWLAFDPKQPIVSIEDISARVSTNLVFKLNFESVDFLIAKLSYFGKYQNFLEDHTIISNLANNLPPPFDNFLARSLMKEGKVFTFRKQSESLDCWVIFYRPIRANIQPPKILNEGQIRKLGEQVARFHKSCDQVASSLPTASKTLRVDINHLREILNTERGKFEHRNHESFILDQCSQFEQEMDRLQIDEQLKPIPVFIDWNIGNFSVDEEFNLFSRWDYDWFRMSSRVMDFYFLSRVVSTIGDRTFFSYLIDPLLEDRFILFLKAYHAVFPLTELEILLLKEAYRFFILNYVIKDGRYFFHEIYASRLQAEAYKEYLPNLDRKFNAKRLLQALNL